MILKFKYGFFSDDILFGWKDKELYRLPQIIGKRFYPLKKLNLIDVGEKKGYLICQKRKSISQLENMTIVIDREISVIKDDDLPF